jgi:hypothetical protein
MNRINPLYLGFLLVAMVLFFSYKLSGAKNDLTEAKESYRESLKLGVELSGLKKVYTSKLNLSSFKSSSLLQKESKPGVILSSESMDVKVLNSLMSKVLNGAYNITSLKIKRISESKVSLHLEIKW